MNNKGFALIESILLFAGAVLICTAILSSFFSNQHFTNIVSDFNDASRDETFQALYE